MNLTKHFTRREMERSSTATRLGIPNVCPPELIANMLRVAENLEKIREHYKVPVHVLSCYRSPAVNASVGGSKTSAHRFALAADCEVSGEPHIEVCRWIIDNIPDYDQVIYEFGPDGWVHLGFTNGVPRKQVLSAVKIKGKTIYLNGLHE